MKKKEPLTYLEAQFLTTEEVQKDIEDLLAHNRCGTYKEELDFVLDSFHNRIMSSHVLGGHDNLYGTYHDTIESAIKNIKKCVDYYLKGRIYSSYVSFNRYWDKQWDNIGLNTKILQLDTNEIFYKLRKKEETPFERKDFFHVPFDKRGKIGNNRYSISGYPCLYLGRSIYTCWEEIRRPDSSDIVASAFKIEKALRLLDLRLQSANKSSANEMDYWALLPYILASSIRVHNDDVFKPEYIIPQLLLHTVVKNRKKYGYDGVIFTSTRRNVKYDDEKMELYDNIAIPVMSNRYKSYCKILASYFTETEPVYFEHEFLKGHIFSGSMDDGKYENTIFYALEKILQKKEFKAIL